MTQPDPAYRRDDVPPSDPFAPVDYPSDYPAPPAFPPLPPPVYPGGYPGPVPGYPGYPPYAPYGPYGPPVPAGTNGKAIAAAVCGGVGLLLCGCFVPSLVAIVLGIIAIGETGRTGQAGRGLAITGVALGAVSVLGGIFVLMVAAAGS